MRRETPRKFSTTPGTRDILPPESTRLLDVQAGILGRFRMHGFREVVTPALEYSEVVEEPRMRDAAVKLFDPDNQTVLLRPEMTTPIARLVAQRLSGGSLPHKLSYGLPVYRRADVGRGQSAEFHQAGIEVVGSGSPGEDAGAISLLVEALEGAGLRAPADFVVVLGQTAFYEGYLRRGAPGVAPELLDALAAKDLVRVDELAASLSGPVAEGARAIPRLVGPAADGSVVEEAEGYVAEAPEAALALENLREILAHLSAHGRLGSVMLDLGLIGRHNYYTGAVYEVYASGLGFTVANGGRYDNLLKRFGEPLPATGFAISLERLISVLPDEKPAPLLVLVGEGVETTRASDRLRSSGVPVLRLAEDLPTERAAEYARSVAAGWVGYPAPDGIKLSPTGSANASVNAFEFLGFEAVAGRVLPVSGLRVAVPKGAIFEDSLAVLAGAGLAVGSLREDGRRLFHRAAEDGGAEFIVSRPSDVPVFVEYGAADVGIVGKDVLEEVRPNVVELKDLGIGACRMVLAAPRKGAEGVRESISRAEVVRVATKFPNTARRYFEGVGRQAEIIELHGSIELAPLVGLAECVVDLTATGTTLRENDLVILDDIASSTARLISNRGSYRLRHAEVAALVDAIGSTRSAQRSREPVG